METITIETGEFVYHDASRRLKIRKPMSTKIGGSVSAICGSWDAWHPDAFVGTPVEGMIPGGDKPRQRKYDLIDWCGNAIGQIDPPTEYNVGTEYSIRKLGIVVSYELRSIKAECMPDNHWVWVLYFEAKIEIEKLEQKLLDSVYDRVDALSDMEKLISCEQNELLIWLDEKRKRSVSIAQ